jgi:crotonobetainyl-CoA:carnitine CoA-transferase CaiB-like acyl-CoA transferase
MIERPDLASAPQYERNADRVGHREELDAAVAAWCGRHLLAEIQTAADAAGIGNARYNRPSEVLAHPDLSARSRWHAVATPGGPTTAALPPPVFGDRLPGMGAVPALGEHTADILTWLGYDPPDIAALRAAGVIGMPPRSDANS